MGIQNGCKVMANSSHNSSYSLHNATPKQFEEAFEELYLHSPLPKFTKPLFAAREKRLAPPAAQLPSRVKIKAIFDTMKERNSSMCSEINSSICTSNNSMCDVDAERLPARDGERPRQKENKTPSSDKEQTEVDPTAGLGETPRSSRRPAVADSPALRAALHFSQHAALLDSLSASGSAAGGDTERDTALTAPSTSTAQLGDGQPHTCPAQDRESSHRRGEVTDAGDSTDPSDPRTDRENATAAEKVTSEICLPLTQGTVEVTAGQCVQNAGSSLSDSMAFDSAHSSPSKWVDESAADQETLQLVSMLVQRLQRSGQKTAQDEDSDDWDVVQPLASPSKATSRDLQLSQTSGAMATHADDDSHSDHQGLTSNPVSSGSRSTAAKGSAKATVCSKRSQKTTRGKTDSQASSDPVDTAKTCATTEQRQRATSRKTAVSEQPTTTAASTRQTRSAARQQKTAGTSTTTTQHTPPAVREASSTGEGGRKPKGKNTAAVRSGKVKAVDEREKVEADIITRPALKPVRSTKDPFSLDISIADEDLQVDEDTIACAAKTLGRCRPGTRQRAGAGKATRSTAQASTRQEVKADRRAEVKAAAAGKVKKVHKLSCWSLQPVAHLKSVRIEGKLPNTDYFWLSSVIVDRVSSRVVKSTSGSLYQLVGNMAELHSRAAGFSEEFTQLFKRGFPVDWKELVESSVAAAEKNAKRLLSGTLPMPSTKNSKQDSLTLASQGAGQKEKTNLLRKSSRAKGDQGKGTRVRSSTRGSGEGEASRSPLTKNTRGNVEGERSRTPLMKNTRGSVEGERSRTPLLRKSKAAGDPSSFRTPPQQKLGTVGEDGGTIWTPQGVMSRQVEANAVRRTRSGRCVIPPLARWAGQYLWHDDNGNVTIAFASMAAEKHFSQMKQQEMLAPVRLRNTPMSLKIQPVKMATGSRGGSQHSPARKMATGSRGGSQHSPARKMATGSRGGSQHSPARKMATGSRGGSQHSPARKMATGSRGGSQHSPARKMATGSRGGSQHSPARKMATGSRGGSQHSPARKMATGSRGGSQHSPARKMATAGDKHTSTTGGTGQRGRGQRGGGSRGRPDVSVDKCSQKVMSLEEEVMSLVQQSKARRLRQATRKRITCYANAATDSQRNRKAVVSLTSSDDDSDNRRNRKAVVSLTSSDDDSDNRRNRKAVVSLTSSDDDSDNRRNRKAVVSLTSSDDDSDSPRNRKAAVSLTSSDDDSDNRRNRKAAVSHTSSDDDSGEDFVPQKNPVTSRIKPVSVYVRRLMLDSAEPPSEDVGLKGRGGTRRRQTAKLSPSPPQKKDKGGGRGKAQLSDDCSEEEEEEERRPKRTNTRRRATRARAAGGTNRGKKRCEPVIDSDDSEVCPEERDSEQTETASCTVTTASSHSRGGTTGTARRNTGQGGMPAPTSNVRRSRRSRQTTAHSSTRPGGVDEELAATDDSVGGEDGEETPGSTKGRGQSRSRRQRGTGRTAPLKGWGRPGPSLRENLSASADSEDARPWSAEEIKNLHRGVEGVRSDQPDYWEAVSGYVGSRYAKECAVFHLKDDGPNKAPTARNVQPSAQQHDRPNNKTPVLLGKRGTLKRRRELRAILEHDRNKNGDDNQDDLFQATPFRAGKKAKVATVDFSKTDEEVFGRNPNFFTPHVDETWQSLGRTFSKTPASTCKTPTITTAPSPWATTNTAHKRDIDQYIFRLKKNKRQLTKSFSQKKPQQGEGQEADAACSTSLALFARSAPGPQGLFSITEDTADPEDGTDDYYYSEEEY